MPLLWRPMPSKLDRAAELVGDAVGTIETATATAGTRAQQGLSEAATAIAGSAAIDRVEKKPGLSERQQPRGRPRSRKPRRSGRPPPPGRRPAPRKPRRSGRPPPPGRRPAPRRPRRSGRPPPPGRRPAPRKPRRSGRPPPPGRRPAPRRPRRSGRPPPPGRRPAPRRPRRSGPKCDGRGPEPLNPCSRRLCHGPGSPPESARVTSHPSATS